MAACQCARCHEFCAEATAQSYLACALVKALLTLVAAQTPMFSRILSIPDPYSRAPTPNPAPEDFTACLWDAATGAHLRTLHGGCGAVGALAFTGDSRVLALGGGERGKGKYRKVERCRITVVKWVGAGA